MQNSSSDLKTVLITGGTSGLGLELVKLFLQRGYYVIATGRKSLEVPEFGDRFKLFRVDFYDLRQTADTIRTICDNYSVSYVINNAGILSPPDFTTTKDGIEYTFQVNYLAHLLINEIIIQRSGKSHPLRLAAITSVVHKIAKPAITFCRKKEDYTPLKAYSDSKLFIAVMCNLLAKKYQEIDFRCFSIDPGVFGSSIYRMQHSWFRFLYHVAAPFMKRPSKIAMALADILTGDEFTNGVLYDTRKRIRHMKELDPSSINIFREECYKMLNQFLD